eukprot:1193798-Alexandrium_andersonii.AAC.1
MSVDPLLFRTRAVRPQASSAPFGDSASRTRPGAARSVAVAMPPKRGDQLPGGGWQTAGRSGARGRSPASQPAERRR